jgi:hypothetical protein
VKRRGIQNFPEDFFMMKKALLIAVLVAAGSAGFVSAQDATPIVAARAKPIAVKKLARLRIVYLKDRIENQRERIARGLNAGTLTGDQAAVSRAILDNVESKMKAERLANGAKKTISRETYEAYNTSLDANSSLINERREYFYYYGPYADSGEDYVYYYDAYPVPGTPTPAVLSDLEKSNPRMFELRDRLAGQRARIQRDLDANSLTADQAKTCDGVLDSVANQMKVDFTANGSLHLTLDQYEGLNAMLDANSTLIQESRQYYYYYNNPKFDPNYDQTFSK